MTKLKTLKDIKFEPTGTLGAPCGWCQSLSSEEYAITGVCPDCINECIKEEAIKWYKQKMKEVTNPKNAEMCREYFGALHFIKEFFNLTEEDLK